MQVVNALVKANKTFDLLVIPGADHSAGRSDGLAQYGERKRFDFFVTHLLGKVPPTWNNAAPPAPTATSASRRSASRRSGLSTSRHAHDFTVSWTKRSLSTTGGDSTNG